MRAARAGSAAAASRAAAADAGPAALRRHGLLGRRHDRLGTHHAARRGRGGSQGAADRTRIRVSDAGAYSGTYTVADTGRAIKGEEIDIYIPDDGEARRFGRRRVQVEVLAEGHGR